MSLFESGDSTGEVSLARLLDGDAASAARPAAGLRDVAAMLCRGGWPGQLDLPLREVQENLRGYVSEIARTDVRRLDRSAAPDPVGVERLLRSLARNTATEARDATLAADVEPEPLHRHSVRAYTAALRRLFVLEEQPAWPVRLRSRAALRKSPKRHLADPSLAAVTLGTDPDRLMSEPDTLGLLFESLVVRDLRVLAQPLGGRVYHLRNAAGQETDAVVECPDGRWLAVEIKLGGPEAIESAAQSLLRLASKLDDERLSPQKSLLVITAVGYGYQRPDGVNVAPITALGP